MLGLSSLPVPPLIIVNNYSYIAKEKAQEISVSLAGDTHKSQIPDTTSPQRHLYPDLIQLLEKTVFMSDQWRQEEQLVLRLLLHVRDLTT